MKKMLFSVAICLLFVIPLPAFAIAAQKPNQTNLNAVAQSVGTFEVSILNDGQWQPAGVLEYNKYLREKKIELSRFLSTEEKIRIRLVHKGGGAAHIDSVLLGGLSPVKITGCDDKIAVTKLKEAKVSSFGSIYHFLTVH